MSVLKVIGGVIAGTLAALLLGALIDYANYRSILPAAVAAYAIAPWIAAVSGFLGAIVALLVAKPAAEGGKYPAARPSTGRGKAATPAGSRPSSQPVAGMPTFDYEAARQQAAAERTAASSTQKDPPQ